jgi:8-oxo-dGTP diphosphatase
MSDVAARWSSPLIGVACLIQRGDSVLLMRRRGPHGGGTWCPPGGHLDHGESVEACASREAREETGLVVEQVRFIAVTEDRFEESGRHYVTIWMAAEAPDGEPRVAAPEEMDEIAWFRHDALPTPLFQSLANLIHRPLFRLPGVFPGLAKHP